MTKQIILGRTGLQAGKLGIASSFRAPASAYEEAFEKGCNYFTWGTFIKGRCPEMEKAVRNIVAKGERDKLIMAMLTYAHIRYLTDVFFNKGLKRLGIEQADVLLLGYFPKRPSQRLLDGALALKEKGLVKFIGLSGHNRKLFSELHKEGLIDVFHFRYNAAHRGAETEIFPHIQGEQRPGLVSFTATRWRKLLKQKKMPTGVTAPTAADCYRFVLANPAVDICMMGAANEKQMKENLELLDQSPMTDEELKKMRMIGDHIYGRK